MSQGLRSCENSSATHFAAPKHLILGVAIGVAFPSWLFGAENAGIPLMWRFDH
jgi:hypothetical protein